MALRTPNDSDVRKIHREVNQIVNQRLLLTTLAVTIFGAVMAWIIPEDPLPANSEIGGFIYTASMLLSTLLFALFLLAHHLTSMLRIFTTYLQETETSNWEIDWKTYRDRFAYIGYTKPQSAIFLLLIIIVGIFPFILWLAYPITIEPRTGEIISVILTLAYTSLVAGMGFSRWFAREDELRRKWKELNQP